MDLKKFLTQNSMSLACLAEKCAVSPSTIMRVRDGAVIPSRRTIGAIIKATDGQVGITDLVKLEPPSVAIPSSHTELTEPEHE